MPQKITWPISLLFKSINFVADKTFFPYRFYNYELTPNVERAYQAIAINDERKSFWPLVWTENSDDAAKVNTIEQVWFAGMHSNVGGVYERAGLANICLHWMMTNVSELKFKDGVKEQILANADSTGRMYNSRNGYAALFRYDPRNITQLCAEAGSDVKIHESAMDRLKTRIANYAPTLLPMHFQRVNDAGESTPSQEVHQEDWNLFQRQMFTWINTRKTIYKIVFTLILGVGAAVLNFKKDEIVRCCVQIEDDWYIKILDTLTPDIMDGLIRKAFADDYHYGIGFIVLCAVLFFARRRAKNMTIKIAEKLRRLILHAPRSYFLKSGGDDSLV